MPLSLFKRTPLADANPLYQAIVRRMRQPDWYRDAQIPDTIDGRFAVLATLLALTDLRLGRGGAVAHRLSPRLTELFVADMDAQMREAGFGDPTLGKRVRDLVRSLAGKIDRLGAAGDDAETAAALATSLYRDGPSSERGVRLAAEWRDALDRASDEDLEQGRVA